MSTAPSSHLHAADGHAPGRPPARPPVLLIGTPQTVRWLHAQAESLPAGPLVRGCLLIGGATQPPPDDLPVPVLGGLDDLPTIAARYALRTALVCLPAAMRDAATRVSAALRRAGLAERPVPTIDDLLCGHEPHGHPAAPLPSPGPAIDMARLVGRVPHGADREAVAAVLAGKRILITGAGGSIGSELARVAATFGPAQLILMERSENALFEIDRQMARWFPAVPRKAVLHDACDAEATLRLCAQLRPHAVFHAAAHKHVPLMEDHPAHAVTNNLFGTKSVADAAVACGAERFVMISSDKAVNPTSVMGATKRLAELYVRALGPKAPDTRLSMVRFGNVLGSACSVLTIWSSQLAEGGPITVTDPRMTRYFMTIPEAATLVIQSTTLSPSPLDPTIPGSLDPSSVGVFVLDMGAPVRILDLAARFVRAHGLEPRVRADTAPAPLDADVPPPPPGAPTVDIVFSGARPGEKLHEELAYAAESLRPTAHPGVRAWAGPGFSESDAAAADDMVAELASLRFSTDPQAILAAIRRHVPEMHPPSTSSSASVRATQTRHAPTR